VAQVTSGTLLDVVVGSGGTGGSSCICAFNTPGLSGTAGGNTIVTDAMSVVLVSAGGGQGGASALANCTGGSGGAGGISSAAVSTGGAAGTNGVSGNPSIDPIAGFGGNAGGGGGSGGMVSPRESVSVSGVPNGVAPGGGASGSNWINANGGNGAAGRVIIYY
jgi:hypothetical protein